ncbi:hypothetical protein ACFFRR_011537 [Megaselia abdita]
MSQGINLNANPPPQTRYDSNPPSTRYPDDWDARDSQRQRELEEARARAAQMEKTMKWWSDCTANWREKWSKVRNERNKAREEAKQLRANLEAAIKESHSYKREKNDLELQISQLKREMEKVHLLMMKHAGQFNKSGDTGEESESNRENNCSPDISSDGLKNVNSEDGLVTKATESKDVDIEQIVIQLKKDDLLDDSKHDFDEDYLLQKISMLQMRLEESQKTIQAERDEKVSLHKALEKVSREIQEVRDRQEELRNAKQEAVRELLTLQEQHRAEVRILNNTIHEETSARECLERRLCELRTELEKFQAENACEWGKRERLETEKLGLERDNKKLRQELLDYQERSDRKGRPIPASEAEVRSLQQEITEKNKELTEIRLSHSKLKKLLAETNTELNHAIRRAEQYEGEVKRLRCRVEELKRELAGAEDELDSACNQVRRLQRTNEELSGQTEGLQVQIHHLQTRRSHSPSSSSARSPILSGECKPNINDLRQMFDESRHFSESKRSSHHERTPSNHSFFEEANIPRNFDFERAKQKFDQHHSHQHHHQREHRERSSSNKFHGSRVSEKPKNLNLSVNTNSSLQYYDHEHFRSSANVVASGNGALVVNGHSHSQSQSHSSSSSNHRQDKKYLRNSINLDGLKISDDDDDGGDEEEVEVA